jgi:hypothetical protein
VCVPSEGGRPPRHTPLHRFRSRQKPTDCRELPFDLTIVHMQAPCTQRGRSCSAARPPPTPTAFNQFYHKAAVRCVTCVGLARLEVWRAWVRRSARGIPSTLDIIFSCVNTVLRACALRGTCYQDSPCVAGDAIDMCVDRRVKKKHTSVLPTHHTTCPSPVMLGHRVPTAPNTRLIHTTRTRTRAYTARRSWRWVAAPNSQGSSTQTSEAKKHVNTHRCLEHKR